jgi:hypothetical protein
VLALDRLPSRARPPRALTSPANCIAPTNNSNFTDYAARPRRCFACVRSIGTLIGATAGRGIAETDSAM